MEKVERAKEPQIHEEQDVDSKVEERVDTISGAVFAAWSAGFFSAGQSLPSFPSFSSAPPAPAAAEPRLPRDFFRDMKPHFRVNDNRVSDRQDRENARRAKELREEWMKPTSSEFRRAVIGKALMFKVSLKSHLL